MTKHPVKVNKALAGWWVWHCCNCKNYSGFRNWRDAYDNGKFHADWYKDWSDE